VTVVYLICASLLAVALLLAAGFVVRNNSLVDRGIGLDLVMSVLLNGLTVLIAASAGAEGIEIVLLIGLLAFLGTVTVARFVERRGSAVADPAATPGPPGPPADGASPADGGAA
jgi:multicomponent Na+:H+ antiporter subunit F